MTDSIHLRSAETSEANDLEALQRRASLVWEEYRADLLAYPDAIQVSVAEIRAGHLRVATVDDRLRGFSAVLPLDHDILELDGLFVEPDVWRAGIGRALVEDAAARGKSEHFSRFEVTANPRALGFYEKLGFVFDGEVPTQFGPGIRMHRDLDSR
jgi:GNAT superfamily N-acetyltransferase